MAEGSNEIDEIVLIPENVDPEDAVVMRGEIRLRGVPSDGDHGDISVRFRVGNNFAGATATDRSGAFVFLASRDDHTLTLRRDGFQERSVEVDWVENENLPEGGRFQVGVSPLAVQGDSTASSHQQRRSRPSRAAWLSLRWDVTGTNPPRTCARKRSTSA